MKRVVLICALAALVPAAARGEPIAISAHSAAGGFAASGDITVDYRTIDLGTLFLPGSGAVGTFFFSDAKPWRDYNVNFTLTGGAAGFHVELLDPLGDGDDMLDVNPQPAGLPAGYSTSNNKDGLSFAQGSGLERSAVFAGGSASVMADEDTHRGDVLMFAGLNGAEDARVTFGLRDSLGGRGFLLRVSAIGADASPAPEPASMLLLGTGLAGLAAARHRRRKAAAAAAR